MALMKYETPICCCYSQRLKVNLGPFARDERLDRIENILEILMVSRSSYYGRLETTMSLYAAEPVAYDLMPPGTVVCPDHANCSGQFCERKNAVVRSASAIGVSQLPPQQRSESSLARGSPHIRRPHIHH